MNALKEWASVVGALEDGTQCVILRKGGILDKAFEVGEKEFLLFPTYEHQEEAHIKKEFWRYIPKEMPPRPQISSYAKVEAMADVDSKAQLARLDSFHIWSDSYLTSRMEWMPQRPMRALLLRVYITERFEAPPGPGQEGCRSWIEINSDLPQGRPVLDDMRAESARCRFEAVFR